MESTRLNRPLSGHLSTPPTITSATRTPAHVTSGIVLDPQRTRPAAVTATWELNARVWAASIVPGSSVVTSHAAAATPARAASSTDCPRSSPTTNPPVTLSPAPIALTPAPQAGHGADLTGLRAGVCLARPLPARGPPR